MERTDEFNENLNGISYKDKISKTTQKHHADCRYHRANDREGGLGYLRQL
jgi:hypothetical protein